MIDIHIYGALGCPKCNKALKFMEDNGLSEGVDFRKHDAQYHLDHYLPDSVDLMAQMSYYDTEDVLPIINYKGEWCDLQKFKKLFKEERSRS